MPRRLLLAFRDFVGILPDGFRRDDIGFFAHFSSDPEYQRHFLLMASQVGVEGALVLSHSLLVPALEATQESIALKVYPVLPNVSFYARASQSGSIRAILKQQLTPLGAWQKLSVCAAALAHLKGCLCHNFVSLSLMAIELEARYFARWDSSVAFLHSQLTDLAVALNNRNLLKQCLQLLQRRLRAQAGLITYNFATLLRRLQEWEMDVPYIVAPFNYKGYLMRPNRQECESLLRLTGERRVFADHCLLRKRRDTAQAEAYLESLPLHGLVLDRRDLAALNGSSDDLS